MHDFIVCIVVVVISVTLLITVLLCFVFVSLKCCLRVGTILYVKI